MAAKNELVTVTEGEDWVRLTDSGATVTQMRVQNVGNTTIIVQATSGSAPTSGSEAGIRITFLAGFDTDKPLTTLFPGVSSISQVWGRSIGGDGEVDVSHAA
jgi:hypothetical protein